jgi:hypothetical protein
MSEEIEKGKNIEKENSKSKKPKLKMNKWIIGLILLVLVLGGLGVYQFKKNKELQTKLSKKEESKDNGVHIEDKEEDSTDSAIEDKTVYDPSNKPV